MKVFMIGGTGLLGSEAAAEMIRRGHEVATLSLPPLPTGAVLHPELKVSFGSYLDCTDDELRAYFADCEGFVFAAGVDERVEGPPPIYDLYAKYNIAPLERLLRIAKESGVKHTVICGSYFSFFAKQRPELELTRHHPYIRSRIDQEELAASFADADFDVAVLELPYIFGTQAGRKPVWVFLVEMIRAMNRVTMFPGGGTTMVTVRQVGQVMAGALERSRGSKNWPIGWYNLTWREFLGIVHKYMGVPGRKIVTIPKWLYRFNGKSMLKTVEAEGKESGLHPVEFAELQCAELFIDKTLGCLPLGASADDIDAAIGDSIQLCLDILDHQVVDLVDMAGE